MTVFDLVLDPIGPSSDNAIPAVGLCDPVVRTLLPGCESNNLPTFFANSVPGVGALVGLVEAGTISFYRFKSVRARHFQAARCWSWGWRRAGTKHAFAKGVWLDHINHRSPHKVHEVTIVGRGRCDWRKFCFAQGSCNIVRWKSHKFAELAPTRSLLARSSARLCLVTRFDCSCISVELRRPFPGFFLISIIISVLASSTLRVLEIIVWWAHCILQLLARRDITIPSISTLFTIGARSVAVAEHAGYGCGIKTGT
ncbi:hypothetical protein BJY04DRAFT_5612 [Aspergillus karnatakaensis]|uniref:uncharacterized protein n=1 Tax=Aspergillus karnatakaensis TaxID=1810916 RepID=UPI003CCCA12B